MDPPPHPLLHFLVRMKPTSTEILLQVAKMWKSQREISELYGGCSSVSQSISEAYPSPDRQYGDGRYHAKVCFRPTALPGFLNFWRVAAPSANKKRTTPLCSSLLASISNARQTHFTLAHLQCNKETTLCTCGFSLCTSPTLQMAVSIRRNSVASFCEECVLWRVFCFHLTVPLFS